MFKRFFLFLIFATVAGIPTTASARFAISSFHFLMRLAETRFFPENDALPVTDAPTASEADMPIAFSADRVGDGALLKWDLPHPAEVASLIIEGSEDGSHFIDLESLEDTEAGVLDVFYDATPKDRRFYRLIANYKDGEQKTTPVGALSPSAVFSAGMDGEQDRILLVTGLERVELYDMQGQLITTAHPVDGKCALELHGLVRGPYLVRAGAHRQVIVY